MQPNASAQPERRSRNPTSNAPTGRPPPSTGGTARDARAARCAWSSTPSRSSVLTNAGAAARSLPSSIRTATPIPASGTAAQCRPSAPTLQTRPGYRLHQSRVRTPAPRDQVRRRAHRLDRPSGARTEATEPLGSSQPGEQGGHAAQREPVDGGAAPVDPHDRPVDAGGRTHGAQDLALERVRGFEVARARSAPERSHARSMPACLPEQLWVIRRGPAAARRASASIGRSGGQPRSRSDSPPARSRRRTTRTWTGSPLCEAHMIATSSSGRGSAIRRRDTAACSGFIEEREKTRRSGSPRAATTRPSGSHTTTWPRWTLSTRPERTTRTSGAAVGTREA